MFIYQFTHPTRHLQLAPLPSVSNNNKDFGSMTVSHIQYWAYDNATAERDYLDIGLSTRPDHTGTKQHYRLYVKGNEIPKIVQLLTGKAASDIALQCKLSDDSRPSSEKNASAKEVGDLLGITDKKPLRCIDADTETLLTNLIERVETQRSTPKESTPLFDVQAFLSTHAAHLEDKKKDLISKESDGILTLTFNRAIAAKDLPNIIGALKNYKGKLNLNFDEYGRLGDEGFKTLIQQLFANGCQVKELTIPYNDITDASAAMIVFLIENSPNTTKLWFSRPPRKCISRLNFNNLKLVDLNCLTAEGGRLIKEALLHNESIEEFSMAVHEINAGVRKKGASSTEGLLASPFDASQKGQLEIVEGMTAEECQLLRKQIDLNKANNLNKANKVNSPREDENIKKLQQVQQENAALRDQVKELSNIKEELAQLKTAYNLLQAQIEKAHPEVKGVASEGDNNKGKSTTPLYNRTLSQNTNARNEPPAPSSVEKKYFFGRMFGNS